MPNKAELLARFNRTIAKDDIDVELAHDLIRQAAKLDRTPRLKLTFAFVVSDPDAQQLAHHLLVSVESALEESGILIDDPDSTYLGASIEEWTTVTDET